MSVVSTCCVAAGFSERLAKVAEKQKADAPKAMAEYRTTEAALRKRTTGCEPNA
jgi:hypothetical protein